jgi:hypothetical protein
VELDHDMDCIGSVTAFKYVIPAGRIEAMEMGAALLMGARDGPPIMVTGVGVGCSTTSSTREVEGPEMMGFLHTVEYCPWDKCTTHNVVGSTGLMSLLSFTTLPSPLNV